jgi:hypothetical protein
MRAAKAPSVTGELHAFVADRNERRNITKSQKAMGHAMLFPEPAKLKRKGSGSVAATEQFAAGLLAHARAVLAFSPKLAIEVRDGSRTIVLHVLQQWIGAINGQDRRVRPLRRRHFRPPGLRKKISAYAQKIGGCALRPLPKIWCPRLSRSNLRQMRDAPRSSGPRKRRGA